MTLCTVTQKIAMTSTKCHCGLVVAEVSLALPSHNGLSGTMASRFGPTRSHLDGLSQSRSIAGTRSPCSSLLPQLTSHSGALHSRLSLAFLYPYMGNFIKIDMTQPKLPHQPCNSSKLCNHLRCQKAKH